ncbi:MAG: FG-GAP repeat protein [Phycisphaerales bacterium]
MRALPVALLAVCTPRPVSAQSECAPVQIAALLPPSPTCGDFAGEDVALDGDWAIIGAETEDAVGVDSGAVHVFHQIAGVWTYAGRILPDDAQAGDAFGSAVALDGDLAFVGARLAGENEGRPGRVYVFRRTDMGWTQEDEFSASSPVPDQGFGANLAFAGGVLVVGAPDTPVGADANVGAAYVFEPDQDHWAQTAELSHDDMALWEFFGRSVDTDGVRVVVGSAPQEFINPSPGGVYCYERDGGTWTLHQTVTPHDGAEGDVFGTCVALGAGRLVVGAFGSDHFAPTAGAVYVYRLDAGAWTFETELAPIDTELFYAFGRFVDIEGDTLVAYSSKRTGDPHVNPGVHLFRRVGGLWQAQLQFAPPGGFGWNMHLNAGRLIGGWPWADRVDPDPLCNDGAAYIFDLACAPGACSDADLADPTGTLDFSDVLAFLVAFSVQGPTADLASPFGAWDFSDVLAFLMAFGAGCP